MSTWPTFTGSTRSISSMRRFRARNPSSFWTAAFRRDFERNGPSLFRICRTTFEGWKRHKNHPDLARARAVFIARRKALRHAYAAMLWAMEHRLESDEPAVALQIRALRKEMEREFGLIATAASQLLGPVLWWTSRREERRLARGQQLRAGDDGRAAELGGRVGKIRQYRVTL